MKQNPEMPVRFYRTEAGGSPVLDWLRGLDKADRRAIGLDLMRVQFGLADWEATGAKPWRWSLGSALVAAHSADSPAHSVLSRPNARRAARVHQENAENAHARPGPGEAKNEGGCQMKKRNKHIGSSLDDFLKEEGVLEETRAAVLKETLAWQVQQAMEKEKISKAEMARRMKTSRAALDRLLDPGNASVTLQTLTRAAHAVGRDLRIELV